MGTSVRAFLVDAQDRVHRVPVDDLYVGKGKAHPEYAGKRIRYALAFLVNRNRKPLYLERVEYGYVAFGRKGEVDKRHEEEASLLAAKGISAIGIDEKPDRVIDASSQFARKRYQYEYTWKPTPKMVHEMRGLIFGGKGGRRK